jgi:hypothetical protein
VKFESRADVHPPLMVSNATGRKLKGMLVLRGKPPGKK